MKKVNTLLIIFLSFLSLQLLSQELKIKGFKAINNNTLISYNLVSNRQYLTYLEWQRFVFIDYPERLIAAFPGLKERVSTLTVKESIEPYHFLLKHSESYVSDYIFNPHYLDYPVIGVTWEQAQDYNKWLSDRYNESVLIKKKYLVFDLLSQLGEDNFNTESYIAKQYEGISHNGKRLDWSEGLFIPTMRLPMKNEVIGIPDNYILTKYTPRDIKFIKPWEKIYVRRESKDLRLSIIDNYKEIFPPKDIDLLNYKIKELFFERNIENKELTALEIYNEIGQGLLDYKKSNLLLKNKYGEMPYIIIRNKKGKDPIIVSKINSPKKEAVSSGRLSVFRSVIQYY